MKSSEETLCAWCGNPCGDNHMEHNGEVVCLECYEDALNQRIEDFRFWEGVKKKCREPIG